MPSTPQSGLPARVLARVRGWADAVEQAPLGPGSWVAGFLALVALRHLLELLSGRLPVYRPAALLVHYPLAYLAPALTLALLLAVLSGSPVRRVTRLMLAAAGLLLLPPLADLALPVLAAIPGLPDGMAGALDRLASGPKAIGYLYGQSLGETLRTFLDPTRALEGTTAGIRLEALLACLAGALYVLVRGARWWRVVLTLPVLYLTALIFFTLPTRVFELVRLFHPTLTVETFYGGAGLLEGPGDLHDGISIVYLTVLVLLLMIAWLALDGGRAALRRGPGSLGWGHGLLAGGIAAAGLLAGRVTRVDLQAGLTASTFDALGSGAVVAAAILIASAVAARRPGNPVAVATLTAGLFLALGAGYPAFAGALALAGAAWLAGPLAGRFVRGAAAAALSGALVGLAAVVLGYVAPAGPDGLAWIPGSLLVAGLAAGLGGGLAGTEPAGRLAAALASAGALLAVVVWPLVLVPHAATAGVTVVFFGAAMLAARLGLPPGGAGVMRAVAGLLVLSAAWLTLSSPQARGDLPQAVLARSSYHLGLGNEMLDAELYREAETAFRSATVLDPDNAEPHARLGVLEMSRAAAVARAGGLPALRGIGEARNALDQERDRRVRAAIEHFREALERDPRHVPAAYNLGLGLLSLGECDEAISAFDDALEERPGHAGALFERAEALECLGLANEAVEAYERYIRGTLDDPSQAPGRRQAREKIRVLSMGRPSGATPETPLP